MESLARSDFGHVHVLATESYGYEVDLLCFDHSLVVLKSRQGLAICHVGLLCFGAFDLHLLDFSRRTPLAIGIPSLKLGQDVGLLSL